MLYINPADRDSAFDDGKLDRDEAAWRRACQTSSSSSFDCIIQAPPPSANILLKTFWGGCLSCTMFFFQSLEGTLPFLLLHRRKVWKFCRGAWWAVPIFRPGADGVNTRIRNMMTTNMETSFLLFEKQEKKHWNWICFFPCYTAVLHQRSFIWRQPKRLRQRERERGKKCGWLSGALFGSTLRSAFKAANRDDATDYHVQKFLTRTERTSRFLPQKALHIGIPCRRVTTLTPSPRFTNINNNFSLSLSVSFSSLFLFSPLLHSKKKKEIEVVVEISLGEQNE